MRTDYATEHIRDLFELGDRQAGSLLRTIATQKVNGGYLVSRQALQVFLEEADKAEDLEAFMAQRRLQPRRFPRRLSRRSIQMDDVPRLTCDQLPDGVTMLPGRMVIEFFTFEHLMDSWWRMASIAWNNDVEFRERWEPKPFIENDAQGKKEFLQWQFEELDAVARAKGFASYKDFEAERTRDWLLKREVQSATLIERARALEA